MVNNGSVKYDHDTDGTHTQLGIDKGCEALLRNKEHDTNIMVRYVDDTVSVSGSVFWFKFSFLCLKITHVHLPRYT